MPPKTVRISAADLAELRQSLSDYRQSTAHFEKLWIKERDAAELLSRSLQHLTSSVGAAVQLANCVVEQLDQEVPF